MLRAKKSLQVLQQLAQQHGARWRQHDQQIALPVVRGTRSTQVRSEKSTRAAVRDLQQQSEPGLRSPVAALLVLRLQLRLGGGKRSAVPRLRVSTVIGALPAALLHRVSTRPACRAGTWWCCARCACCRSTPTAT